MLPLETAVPPTLVPTPIIATHIPSPSVPPTITPPEPSPPTPLPDTLLGTLTLISRATDGMVGNGSSESPSLSADGRFVAFVSRASNLVPDDSHTDCTDMAYDPPQFSCSDLFVYDRQAGIMERVSVDSDGTPANSESGVRYEAGSLSSISADGRFVAFQSFASNLVANCPGSYVYDRHIKQTSCVAVASDGTPGNGSSSWPVVSANGRFVAFISEASNLVPDDTNGFNDYFVHDLQTGITERVSVSSEGTEANNLNGELSGIASLSADGRFIAFQSFASNLVANDTNGVADIFVHDRHTGRTERVSVDSDGTEANAASTTAKISADGRFVAFVSNATNLVLDDTNKREDVFVHDRQTGQTARVSLANDGSQAERGDSGSVTMSANGRWLAFTSNATNLVPNDSNGVYDIFVHDRQTGQTIRASVDDDGHETTGDNYEPVLAADGCTIAFISLANDLVPHDNNERWDVFVRDLCPDKSESVLATAVAIEPLDTAARILIGSWSLDSRWLAYWRFTPEEIAVETYPPGTLHFVEAQTGRICAVPQVVAYPYSSQLPLVWQPNGKVWLQTSTGWHETTPCQTDFAPVLADSTIKSPPSLSPSGRYQVETQADYSDDGTLRATTTITAVTTNTVSNVVEWISPPGLGELGNGGEWITDDLFLIHETLEQGPLLVPVGQQPLAVVSDLMHQSVTGICDQDPCNVRLAATAVSVNHSAAYRLLLYGRGEASSLPPLLLYDSATEQVRAIPGVQQGGFAPTGEALILYETAWDSSKGQEVYRLWLLPLNGVNGIARLLLEQSTHPLPLSWSPDGLQIAFSGAGHLATFSSPEGNQVNLWQARAAFFPGPWSPNGTLLAAKGVLSGGKAEGLFITVSQPTKPVDP